MLELIVLILLIGVVFVNGWTDAPNAIACAVSTGAMRYRSAVWMAALCNLFGLFSMRFFGAPVAGTVFSLADFGTDSHRAMAALCAVLSSVVIFAVAAWRMGIPTSESHALIAAITGAALALGTGKINLSAWGKVLAGLVASVVFGYCFGRLASRLLGGALEKVGERALRRTQILAAGGMAFMHGAQDGQKFVAVFVMAELLAKGSYSAGPVSLSEHMPVLFLCALTMALGTSVGGGRIVELVGGKMVRLKKGEGVCADLGGAVCLLGASLFGLPVSTTHTKTAAMMGAAAGGDRLDKKVAVDIAITWLITFPVCGMLGWGLAHLFAFLAGLPGEAR